jgi:hypothetical protein
LSEASLRAAVGAGVVKVNWSSESLHIRSQAARDFYSTHTVELEKTHPQWKATAMDAGVQGFISKRYAPRLIERLEVLGSTGRAV